MTSDEINAGIHAIEGLEKNAHLVPAPLLQAGKVVPYIGWFWRSVDFDARIRLAHGIESDLTRETGAIVDDIPCWAGFCENNKWDYPMRTLSLEASARIREACEILVKSTCKDNAEHLFEVIQDEWHTWEGEEA